MTIPVDLIRTLAESSPSDSWAAILEHAWHVCSQSLAAASAPGEVANRDRAIAPVDLFLATAGWDLWEQFENSVERSSDLLASWWPAQPPGRAVLILDGLSLREVPWILGGAKERGYSVSTARAVASELPAETSCFARALGFAQRSALENDGAGRSHRLQGARTDTHEMPWDECVQRITPDPDWVLWHRWPDKRLHELVGPGGGIETLTKEVAIQLTSGSFWSLIERLATGRRLVITSDHGYAASGLFTDTIGSHVEYLKSTFKSGRVASDTGANNRFEAEVPPLDLVLESRHGRHRYVLGRRKWKSQGGYPTLAHGGLSVLEVMVPFIELRRNGVE